MNICTKLGIHHPPATWAPSGSVTVSQYIPKVTDYHYGNTIEVDGTKGVEKEDAKEFSQSDDTDQPTPIFPTQKAESKEHIA
jgi:hypothetical protein